MRIKNIIERFKSKSEKKDKLKVIFEKHSKDIENTLICKNKLYINNLKLLNMYWENIDEPRCFEMMRNEIHSNEDYMFDYFLLSKTPQELAKHITLLTNQLLKITEH